MEEKTIEEQMPFSLELSRHGYKRRGYIVQAYYDDIDTWLDSIYFGRTIPDCRAAAQPLLNPNKWMGNELGKLRVVATKRKTL